MRNYFFLILFFLPLISFSQDILLKRNGDELNVKIDNVLQNVVIYSDTTGQYSISRDEIFMIKYADGSKEVFTITSPPPPNPVSPPANKLISYLEDEYYMNGYRTSETVVNRLLITSNDPEITSILKKKSELTVASNVLRFGSIPVGAAGTMFLLAYLNEQGTMMATPTTQYYGIAGLIGVTGFVAMQLGANVVSRKRTKLFNTAIDKYNLSIQNQ